VAGIVSRKVSVTGHISLRMPDSERLARLVRDHRAALARAARREGLPPEDALDVVQDAFVTFLARPDALEGEDARKLLVAIVRNLARNARRLHAHARPHDGDAEAIRDLARDPEQQLEDAEARARLAVCLAKLASRQRSVVLMRLFDGQGGEAVATTLGVSPGHVAVLLHRARLSLCACMAEAG
jgi:RNA polymerase sigma-70 factor (ECF subfamily)